MADVATSSAIAEEETPAQPSEPSPEAPSPDMKTGEENDAQPTATGQSSDVAMTEPSPEAGSTSQEVTKRRNGRSPRSVADGASSTVRPKSAVDRVACKWQMASVAHFFSAFAKVLPLRDIGGEEPLDVSARTLELAIAEPDTNTSLGPALRDAFATLLLALRRVSRPRARTHWYEALCTFSSSRPQDFSDCFAANGVSLLRGYQDGSRFLLEAPWNLRLGAMLSLCDIAAEEADCVRDALRERPASAPSAPDPLDAPPDAYRLQPFGRCNKKRFYYRVGPSRIYSGFKRKGAGSLAVECSDSSSMQALIDRLHATSNNKDKNLADRIRDTYLPAVVEHEAVLRRRKNRLRQIEALRLDDRQRKKLRPRRRRVMYSF